MTANKRIALNVVATYGRSLFSLVCGLIAGRWALLSLGEVDFGLIGVVGGLIAFVGFLNGWLSDTVSRFFAYSVGAAKNDLKNGILECRKWFNVALSLHLSVATVLTVIGYPVGVYLIEHFLNIPPERVADCLVVWQFSCLTCFVGMANVPFQAMYTAKQEIAEMTVYSVAGTAVRTMFLWYMITHPGVWMVKYAAAMCFVSVIPQLLICVRALMVFDECTVMPQYFFNREKVKALLCFAGPRTLGSLAIILGQNGTVILVNKMLGPARNAAMSVGNQVSSQCLTLCSSFFSAFSPVITNAAGAGDYERMRRFIYLTCSISTVAVLIFALPMMWEAHEVVTLWLKVPPEGSAALCVAMLVSSLIDQLTIGFFLGIQAVGRVAKFFMVQAFAFLLILPLAYVFINLDCDIVGVAYAWIAAISIAGLIKLYFARHLCGISGTYWFRRIVLPLTLVSLIALSVGAAPRFLMAPSLMRVVMTTCAVEMTLLPLLWVFVLSQEEKTLVLSKLKFLSRFANNSNRE